MDLPSRPGGAPAPVDVRMARFAQGVTAVALLVGFVARVDVVIPATALVLLTGVAFGPRFGLLPRLYQIVVAPRLDPPREVEDPGPPRFATAIEVAVLAIASLFVLVEVGLLAWALALLVAAVTALAATTGICVGCELYQRLPRLRR